MKKIILKAKINFKSELNLKNLSKINFEEKIISKINILYDNKEFELQELFKIQVQKSDKNELKKQILNRTGQCIMTSPTSAVFSGNISADKIPLGNSLRYFGDGYQISKFFDNKRF